MKTLETHGWNLARIVATGVVALCAASIVGPAKAAASCAAVSTLRQATLDSEYAVARREASAQLVEFAEWCGQHKLFAEREKAWESIVALDPANEAAHKALKHKKEHDGTWSVPEKRTPAKNTSTADLDECRKRRSEIADQLRTRGVALIELYEKNELPRREPGVLDDVLLIDAENVSARTKRGEVQVDGAWVLQETQTAKERRGALKTLIQDSFKSVPAPQTCAPTEREQGLGVTWKQLLATAGDPAADKARRAKAGSTPAGSRKSDLPAASATKVRVLGTCTAEEARKVAIACHAAADVFRELTHADLDLPPNFTVYLLTSAADRNAFIAKWPGWTDDERKAISNWAGTGVPDECHVARWDADEARRLDGAVRHVIGLLTLWNYDFDHRQAAWLWEGFGLYLTRELVGTRLTWYGSGPTSGDLDTKELLGKLMLAEVNWMNECYQRGKRGKTQPLSKLFERKLDQLGVDDVLLAYAFSAYLVEGRPDALPAVFGGIYAGKGATAAVPTALGTDLASLDTRLVRWLSERK